MKKYTKTPEEIAMERDTITPEEIAELGESMLAAFAIPGLTPDEAIKIYEPHNAPIPLLANPLQLFDAVQNSEGKMIFAAAESQDELNTIVADISAGTIKSDGNLHQLYCVQTKKGVFVQEFIAKTLKQLKEEVNRYATVVNRTVRGRVIEK